MLPGSENDVTVFEDQGESGTEQRCFDMRIGIAFSVFVVSVVWDELTQRGDHVSRDIRIRALVDGQSAGRVQ